MNEEKSKSGEFVFRPRARLIKTIGEELISNDNVAITELVKNSYDAGSQIVDITFSGIVKKKEVIKRNARKEIKEEESYIDKESASIIIFDEGSGMSFDTIETAWMEPATNYKKKQENKKDSKSQARYPLVSRSVMVVIRHRAYMRIRIVLRHQPRMVWRHAYFRGVREPIDQLGIRDHICRRQDTWNILY